MPGIYVVTSTALVKRTRATLRSAEFGFFGVCYTRECIHRAFRDSPSARATWSLREPLLFPCVQVAKTSAQSFLFFLGSLRTNSLRKSTAHRAQTHLANSRTARTKSARAHTNAERYCESGENQQETPCTIQETDFRSRYRIGEAYSAFRGWRPIPAALPSHSIELVLGPKNFLPTSQPPLSGRPYYAGNYP